MRGSICVKGALCVSMICTVLSGNAEATSHSYRGEKTLGLKAGYCGSNGSALTGLEFSYRFNRWFRLAADADYVFRRHGRDALLLDVNTQYPFLFSRDRMAVYPQVGINYSSWNYHFDKTREAYDDAANRLSRFGINVGAGYELDLTASLRVGIKAEYVIVKDFNSFNATFRIAYRF